MNMFLFQYLKDEKGCSKDKIIYNKVVSGIVNKTHTGIMQFMPILFLFCSVNSWMMNVEITRVMCQAG